MDNVNSDIRISSTLSSNFSPNMEQGVHHFHTIIKDFMYENDK